MAWYSADYLNRQLITVTGTADGAQTNHQMKFTVYKGNGSSSGLVAYLNMKCLDNFYDVIITKADGTTKLDYWRESVVSGTSEVIWIEFDSIPASPDTITFYIYYNYVSATDDSDEDNTFIFFDHYPGVAIDVGKWKGDTGSASVADSIMTLTTATAAAWKQIGGITEYAKPCALRTLTDFNAFAGDSYNVLALRDSTTFSNDFCDLMKFTTLQKRRTAVGGSETGIISTIATGYKIWDLCWATNHFLAKVDGANMDGGTNPITTNAPTIALAPYFAVYKGTENPIILSDWILIRNYTINDPTVSGWGAEESSGWANIASLKGVAAASIASVNSVPVASIASISGVAV